MNKLLLKAILFFVLINSFLFSQDFIIVSAGLNYGLRTGIRDYINRFNFDNSKLISSFTVGLEYHQNYDENYNIGLITTYNYFSVNKSNQFIPNYEISLSTLMPIIFIEKKYNDNIYYGLGFTYANYKLSSKDYYISNKYNSYSKWGPGFVLLGNIFTEEQDSFALNISPKLYILFPGNLKDKDNYNINLNSYTLEINFGFKTKMR
jgi:hypothetical protein